MRSITIFFVAGLFLFALFITGCDQREFDVPTDPTQVSSSDADWVLAFSYYYDGLQNSQDKYEISLYNTNSFNRDVPVEDIVVLTVGDSIIPLIYHEYFIYQQSGWFADGAYVLNGQQHISLSINGTMQLNTFIKPVGKANAAFPADYNSQQSLTLNWSIAAQNEYQFVRAESYDNTIEGYNPPHSIYSRRIARTAGSFKFPANCVSLVNGYLGQTGFLLCIEEVNYKIVNKTAVMVYQEETNGYNFMTLKNSGHVFSNRALDIHRAFNK